MRYMLYNIRHKEEIAMNLNNSNRELAIKELNQCFKDFSEAVCHEQAPVKQLTRADAKKTAKGMAQNNGRSIDSALDCLNELINQGFEFPSALSLVLDEYEVDQEELTNAYDTQ